MPKRPVALALMAPAVAQALRAVGENLAIAQIKLI
jgi:hypothetical protein